MKKKIVSAILGVAALTSLVACGVGEPSSSAIPSEDTSTDVQSSEEASKSEESSTAPESSQEASSSEEASSEETQSSEGSSQDIAQVFSVVLPKNVKGAYVNASCHSAVEGQEVVLTVVLTNSKEVKLDAVKVGDVTLNGTADPQNPNILTYRFLMGNTDAVISVLTSDIVIPAKDHTITLTANDKVVVNGLAKEANVGDKVEFKVSVISGYTLDKVTVKTAENDVELAGNSQDGYSFIMPDGDVTVATTVLGNYNKLTQNTEKVPTSKYDKYNTADFISKYIDSEGTEYESNLPAFFFRGGSEIKFVARHKNTGTAYHFYVGQVEALPVKLTSEYDETANLYAYSFVMPYEDCEIKATIEITKVNLSLNVPEGVTASLYKLTPSEVVGEEDIKTPVTEARVGEEVYVDVTGTETLLPVGISYDCGIYLDDTSADTKKLEKQGNTAWSNTSTYETFKYVDDDTKLFKIPEKMYSGDITINVETKEAIYTNESFLGNYRGYEWYSHKIYGSEKSLNINKVGLVNSSVSKLSGEVADVTENTLAISSGFSKRTFYFDGETGYVRDSSDPATGVSDVYLFVKDNTKDELTTGFYIGETFELAEFKIGNKSTYFYLDLTNGVVIQNVTVVLEAGDNISAINAKFTIKNGDAILATVVPSISDDGEPVPFASKAYKADYTCSDGWGSVSSATIVVTFDATERILNFTGEDSEASKVNETVAYLYDKVENAIYFRLTGSEIVKATFNADHSELTFTTRIKNGYVYDFQATDKVATLITNAE